VILNQVEECKFFIFFWVWKRKIEDLVNKRKKELMNVRGKKLIYD